MDHKTKMHPRTIALFALLNNAILDGRTLSRPFDISRIRAVTNSPRESRGENMCMYSMAFFEAPPRGGAIEHVLYPFSIAFSMDRARDNSRNIVPVSHMSAGFTLTGGLELVKTTRAFIAVLTYLLRRNLISEATFHRSIERSMKGHIGNKAARTVEEFPEWAARVLKTCPFLDYDDSEGACTELLAYVAPVSERVAA